MVEVLGSRRWYQRLFRIGILVLIGWWMLKATGLVHAELPRSSEWPKTDFSRASVDLDEIQSGGPPKDGIPAIDDPHFVSTSKADAWLDPMEPVIVVTVGNAARAYPLQILIYHEIVNDVVGDLPLVVTFCPLCNASIVFHRRVGDRVLDFGTTGKLRKSDLVMYDRQTHSWWQQFTGRAIVGDLMGAELQQVPTNIVAYQDFKQAYPNGDVLSRRTGHRRPYGRNPYRGYDRVGDQPFAFRDPTDPRLPAMERVINISVGNNHKLYPFSLFREAPVINDEVAGVPVVILSQRGTLSVLDRAEIKASRTVPSATAYERRLKERILTFEQKPRGIHDRETGSRWNLFGQAVEGPLAGQHLNAAKSGVHFAFAWLAFNPDSAIYSLGKHAEPR